MEKELEPRQLEGVEDVKFLRQLEEEAKENNCPEERDEAITELMPNNDPTEVLVPMAKREEQHE